MGAFAPRRAFWSRIGDAGFSLLAVAFGVALLLGTSRHLLSHPVVDGPPLANRLADVAAARARAVTATPLARAVAPPGRPVSARRAGHLRARPGTVTVMRGPAATAAHRDARRAARAPGAHAVRRTMVAPVLAARRSFKAASRPRASVTPHGVAKATPARAFVAVSVPRRTVERVRPASIIARSAVHGARGRRKRESHRSVPIEPPLGYDPQPVLLVLPEATTDGLAAIAPPLPAIRLRHRR